MDKPNLERAVERLGQLAMHEASALDAHLLTLKEHWALARRARSFGELLRDQIDLVPAVQRRLVREHRQRVNLLRGLLMPSTPDLN